MAYTFVMDPSDQDIIRQTLVDRHMFCILVDRYQDALLRYVRRLGCTDIEVAKDILQESFIKAYLNLNDYDSAYSFSTWLYRITHNETMSHFRKQKNRPQALTEESAKYVFNMLPDGIDMAEEMDIKLRSQAVEIALKKLKPQYRDVLVLKFFEEKTYDEIADILRIPNGTVATYIARGKADLNSLLKAYKADKI